MDIVNGQAAILAGGDVIGESGQPGESDKAGCLEAINELGQYSQAAVVYSGLVVGSLLNRGGMAVASGVKHSATAIQEAGRYSWASVAYTGLVSASLVKRGATASGSAAAKVVSPVAHAVARPFSVVAGTAGKLFKRTAGVDEKTKALEEKVLKLEERVAKLERFGIRAHPAAFRPVKKEVSDNKRAFLQAILLENKKLRAEE